MRQVLLTLGNKGCSNKISERWRTETLIFTLNNLAMKTNCIISCLRIDERLSYGLRKYYLCKVRNSKYGGTEGLIISEAWTDHEWINGGRAQQKLIQFVSRPESIMRGCVWSCRGFSLGKLKNFIKKTWIAIVNRLCLRICE